ncbi:hypothetical protein AB0K02_14770 [Streptomyces sp. NPDC049597]|uniref:hypothetical protein n=1 Tax=Streptomyces sp. NPDC049597 TaxID=3155276 RepID=UPI003432E417
MLPGVRLGQVASGGGHADAFSPWVPGALQLGEFSGHVLVARDEDMVAEWHDSGYALDTAR